MVRRGRKSKRGNVYYSNLSRMSVYPSFKKPTEEKTRERLREGDIIKVKIVGIDENGRGIAYYRSIKILIDDVMPGVEVMCKIIKAMGKIAFGKPLKS